MSLIQTKTNENQAGGSTVNATFASVPTAGNCVVVAFYRASTGGTTTVTDDMGNTYHLAKAQANGTSWTTEVWYTFNISVSGTHKVTCSNTVSGANCGLLIHEWSSFTTTDPLNNAGSTSGTAAGTANDITVNVTAPSGGGIAFGFAACVQGGRGFGPLASGGGFTTAASDVSTDTSGGIDATNAVDGLTDSKITSSSGTVAVQFSSPGDGGEAYSVVGVAFKTAGTDATFNISGLAATMALGAAIDKVQENITGFAATTQLGTLTNAVQVNLVGFGLTVALTIADAHGFIVGVANTAQIGTCTEAVQFNLLGFSPTTTLGAFTETADVNTTIGGVTAAANLGTPRTQVQESITGFSNMALLGAFTTTADAPITITGFPSTVVLGALTDAVICNLASFTNTTVLGTTTFTGSGTFNVLGFADTMLLDAPGVIAFSPVPVIVIVGY